MVRNEKFILIVLWLSESEEQWPNNLRTKLHRMIGCEVNLMACKFMKSNLSSEQLQERLQGSKSANL